MTKTSVLCSRASLALAIAAAAMPGQSSAYSWNIGEANVSLDTTLTAGVGWRIEDQKKDIIAQGNLGPSFVNTTTGASTNNGDDGNLNFEPGDTYSKIVKGTSELLVNYDVESEYLSRVGGFVRGRYWYDFELKDEMRAVDPVGQRRELNSEAKANASGAEFLDAYVYSDWYFGNVPVGIRYGNQVVSWGESTFIQGGVNSVNPVDVQAFRAPGAEIKDALLPVEMLFLSLGLTETVSLESFVQTDWEPFRPDDCGTFFSTNDLVSDGCGPLLLAGQVPDSQAFEMGLLAERLDDREPDEKDQFGFAVRWYVPELNDSELGFYYLKYNSRLPYVSVQIKEDGQNFPNYYVEYPENIDLYGISISTTAPGGWSVGAEYSFKNDVPVQWNGFELTYTGLLLDNPANGAPASLLEQRLHEQFGDDAALRGKFVEGYDRYDVSQVQATFINFYDRIMGASRMTVVAEVGGTYVHGLPDYDEARYGRGSTFGIGTLPDGGCTSLNINDSYCTTEGYVTSWSWGYRTRFSWDYPNAIAGINLSPQIAWSHDVNGNAPQPGGNFIENRKALGLSLTGVYQNRTSATVAMTRYLGGDPYNEEVDRDFVTLSVSHSF